jgi:Tfp pilus assembly PilM family ATPase
MAKRCIGIDISSSHLCAVQLSQTNGLPKFEKIFTAQMRRCTDSVSNILKILIKQQGFDRRADVAISMPNDAIFFRSLESDSVSPEQMLGSGRFALEHNFPIPSDKIIAQEYSRRQLPDKKCSVLIAATTKASLHESLNLFTGTGMHPKLAEAPIFAVLSTIAVNHPQARAGIAVTAFIDKSHIALAIAQNNNILIVRNIPISCGHDSDVEMQLAGLLSNEIKTTWLKVFGNEVEQGCRIYISSTYGNFDGLKAIIEENLSCKAIVVDTCARIESPSELINEPAICVAEGLALRMLAPEKTTGINFLEADNKHVKPVLNLKKEFITCAILGAAIVLVSLGGLFVRLSNLETEYTKLKSEVTEIFQRTLPEEKNIVSPLVQLEQKLKSLRKDYRLFASFCPTSLSPLEVLRRITVNTPQNKKAKIDNLFITSESIRLSGTCHSFESVYEWQQLLQKVPEFVIIDVQDVQRETESGDVRFTMLITSTNPSVISEYN